MYKESERCITLHQIQNNSIVQKLALPLVLTFYTSSVDHIEPLENLDSIKMTQRVRT